MPIEEVIDCIRYAGYLGKYCNSSEEACCGSNQERCKSSASFRSFGMG